MPTESQRESVFRRMLVREAGTNADASLVAAAARRLCEQFARELTPLIGALGVAAIYARSLHLAQRRFPQLAPFSASQQEEHDPISRAQRLIERQELTVAIDVAGGMLASVVQLLTSFIGEGLTASLLRKAWPDDFARSSTEDITR
jgi:hypothetical protein